MTVRGRLLPALLGVVLAGSLLTTGAAAGPAPIAASAGSAGVGDPYFPKDGNGGIDVRHYDIRDSYAFGSGRLRGRTTLDITATRRLTRFNLDFLLPATSVRVAGRAARFTRSGDHELRITPAKALAAGDRFRVVVRYDGFPARQASGGERNWLADDSEVVTMNEPHMATWWFPANDHPSDKASFDIRITVPRGTDVVANGTLVGRTRQRGQVTSHWRAAEPMATYLAFFAAGRFEIRKGSHLGRPWYVAVSEQVPESHRSASMRALARSGELTAWLESRLGAYPFSSTGGLVTGLDVTFALENQTRPTYPWRSAANTSLQVHELAHQWFGDSVSVQEWRDIWLNEGFATFMEVHYAESQGGLPAQAWLLARYEQRAPGDPFWQLPIGDPGRRHLFDAAVYERGAMAVQALRHRLGEAAFWQVVRTWLEQRRYGNGSVADLAVLAESVSGADLDGFFDAWLHRRERPVRTADNGLL